MLASPSIQEIASALARTTTRATTRTPSRVLCLKLQELPSTGFKRAASPRSIAEAFLKYSPRVHLRSSETKGRALSPLNTHWVFIDIASTSHLFDKRHGEESLMRSSINLARDLGFGVQCAVADTPSGAQAFAAAHPEIIIPPGEERDRLKCLSLPHLLHLEGLQAWAKPGVVEGIITFFMMLGFKSVDDLSRFTMASLQERWGETGALLWKRLHAQDRQVVSPLFPTEPLEDYVHLDFPVSLVSLLLHQMEKSVDFLFARLQGRRFSAKTLVVTLHCEYSKAQHRIEIEPNTPSRDRDLFLTLLENRLGELDLLNPVRDFEVHVVPCPEKVRQLDFFEPQTTDNDRLQTLLSLFTQSALRPGLYRIEAAIKPEDGWRLVSSPEEHAHVVSVPLEPSQWTIGEHHRDYKGDGQAIAPQPYYGSSAMRAPRPTRLLAEPMPLSTEELQNLKILSSNPIERFEHGWWDAREMRRDYYFAVSSEGECLWIFQDLRTEEYFLHGYFD